MEISLFPDQVPLKLPQTHFPFRLTDTDVRFLPLLLDDLDRFFEIPSVLSVLVGFVWGILDDLFEEEDVPQAPERGSIVECVESSFRSLWPLVEILSSGRTSQNQFAEPASSRRGLRISPSTSR